MRGGVQESLPEFDKDAAPTFTTGVLPSQTLREFESAGYLRAPGGLLDGQIQPASIDLRLGQVAYRVRASFLPSESATVRSKLEALCDYQIGLAEGAILERGCVYIVPLQEELRLPPTVSGRANPKSTTGRLDVFTRLICDNSSEFERVRPGYHGPLYAEIVPRTFSVIVRPGTTMNQLRLVRGNRTPSDREITELHDAEPLLYVEGTALPEPRIQRGLWISVDLVGVSGRGPVGYRAKRTAPPVDFDARDRYDPEDFWEAIGPPRDGTIVIDPDDFHILASKEKVSIPTMFSAEMIPYDPSVGEFRIHYAGFFDPGFGHGEGEVQGAHAVLEVRSHEVPFLLEHGQRVGRLVFERLLMPPDRLYGGSIGSSYQGQGLRLGRQFKLGTG